MSNRPQPVLTAAAVAGIITSVAAVAGTLGFTSAETKLSGSAQALAAVVVAAVVLVSHVLAALHARQAVTPIADPHDGTGAPLIPTARSYGPIEIHSTAPSTILSALASVTRESEDLPPDPAIVGPAHDPASYGGSEQPESEAPTEAVGDEGYAAGEGPGLISTGTAVASGPYPASFGQTRPNPLITPTEQPVGRHAADES